MRIAVTGATGFIGKALCFDLSARNYSVVALIRSQATCFDSAKFIVSPVGEVNKMTNWVNSLKGVDCVVHCAALTNVVGKLDTLAAYRAINVDGTRQLAEQAVQAGVKRLVYLSSIKVNGEESPSGLSFNISDALKPESEYGISKWEAEQALRQIAVQTGIEIVIIRPPLVYGPEVKGSFRSILKLLSYGIPLPLGAVENKRSFVNVENLIDLIVRCIQHPAAANRTFLVSDGEDLSTTNLLIRLSNALNKPANLFPCSTALLQIISRLLGQTASTQRLLGNLQVDISETRELLNWNPPVSVDEGFRKTAAWFVLK